MVKATTWRRLAHQAGFRSFQVKSDIIHWYNLVVAPYIPLPWHETRTLVVYK